MRFSPCILRLVASLIGVASLATADGGPETALPASKPGSGSGSSAPMILKIAVNDIYCTKTACDCISTIATRDYAGLVKALKDQHNIDLRMTYFMEVFDLEKEIPMGTHDGVICKPWTALHLAAKAKADFKRVADLRDPDNSAVMTGVFLTLKDSPIRSLEDLKGRRIAFGKDDSYEKNQSPLAMLASKKVSLGECLYLSSCGENLDALMSGKVDAAVVSSYALTASCAVDFAKPEDFRTIAKTEEMPLTSLLLDMNKVNHPDAVRLQKALLSLAADKAPGDLCGDGFVLPPSWKPLTSGPPSAP